MLDVFVKIYFKALKQKLFRTIFHGSEIIRTMLYHNLYSSIILPSFYFHWWWNIVPKSLYFKISNREFLFYIFGYSECTNLLINIIAEYQGRTSHQLPFNLTSIQAKNGLILGDLFWLCSINPEKRPQDVFFQEQNNSKIFNKDLEE